MPLAHIQETFFKIHFARSLQPLLLSSFREEAKAPLPVLGCKSF